MQLLLLFSALMENQLEEDMNRIRGHIKAIGAPVYQSFNVYVLNKVRARSEIHLGRLIHVKPDISP